MKNKLFIIIFLVTSIVLTGCSSSFYEEQVLSDVQWIEDIDYLDNKLKEYHPDLFKFISEDKWNKNIENLKSEVPELSDTSIKLRISQIIASIGDAHTSMLPSELLSPVPSPILRGENPNDIEGVLEFPIKCDYFDDGVRVIECDSKYKEILGYKIISINNMNINSIINDIGTLFACDYNNEQKGLEYAKEYLNVYEFLKFFNVIGSNKAEYVFENDNDEKIHLSLKATENKNIDYISVSKKDMKTSMIPKGKSEFYWYENFQEDNILFLKFNSFISNTDNEKCPNFYDFQDRLLKEINNNNYHKFVIDLRNNRGGKTKILNSMIEMFKYKTNLNSENIYVITGKKTNSASVLLTWDLQSKRGATVVGEVTGGNINLFFTNSSQLELSNSKLKPTYSLGFINNNERYNGGVKPDIEIIQDYEDYINGIDTCYEYIKNININE